MSDRPLLLVADDYPENRKLFEIYLTRVYDVVCVATAEAAYERLGQGDIAAALLDINYQGGMTGIDLVQKIRATPEMASIPTMALTAHAAPSDRQQYINAGFDAYLSKPVMRKEMLAAVEELLA
ncbi:response regulator [Rubrivirga sp. IMCC43871]|uniref:response regulator n=1 Tax=Rubrivirga sp. IMCC43871 TaxID=3391575 RepID=UPI00398F97E4